MPKPTLYAPRSGALRGFVVAAGLAAGGVLHAQPAEPPPCAACLVFVITPGESLLVPEGLDGIELLVRTAPEGTRAGAGGPYAPEHVRSAMAAVRAAGGTAGLFVQQAPAPVLEPELLESASRVVVSLGETPAVDAELLFAVRTQVSELRGLAPAAAIGITAEVSVLDGLLAEGVGAYVDFVVRPGGPPPPFPARTPLRTAGVVEPVSGASTADGDRWIVRLPEDALDAAALLRDVARAAPILRPGLIHGGTADVRCGARRAVTYLDPASLETIALVRECDPAALVVTPAVDGIEQVRLSGNILAVRVPSPEGIFADDVSVVGARTLSVQEIVARHQAAAARQRREIRHLISAGSMTLTFEAPGFPAPVAITSETVIYAAPDRVELEQRDIRINGVAFRSDGIPRLPLLEPERVATPPLAIALTEMYTYSLAGRDRVAGVPCYVVAFTPTDRGTPLFAGRAWIAMDSFAMVRVSAVQTALRGPIVSSEQTDEFRQVGTAWLLARSDVRQIYEGAGHRTPIHRVLAIARHDVNPPDFAARRLAAYQSASVMLRDTPEGFRYLQRDRGATADPAVAPAVTGPSTRVRTFAAGVIVDPNITRPLPFAGFSYVDFDLFGTGTQVNAFFGGTYGQLAGSVPSLRGSRWQVAGRAFGIASSYNDRAFVAGRELYEQNISQRPAHASAWLVRPLTPRLSARAGYDLDYTHFGRADTTAARFVVPADQVAHGLRLAADAQWGGWTATAWWVGAQRSGWRPWGADVHEPAAAAAAAEHADYQRFGGGVGRSWVASPRLVGRVDASWMGGRDLDRFSRYTFGSFDNRLRGYPAALIRYDRGSVLRGSAAWAAGRLLRLDGFLDSAFVHDAGAGGALRNFTGVGAAAEVPVPFGTLLTVEWGYGFQGVNTDGTRGTHVVRISGYKMF